MLDVFRWVRTPVSVVLYALFVRHLGMSLRKIARAISPFVSRSYNAVWKWEKKLKGLRDTFACKCSVSIYLVDDTLVWVGDRKAWIIVVCSIHVPTYISYFCMETCFLSVYI